MSQDNNNGAGVVVASGAAVGIGAAVVLSSSEVQNSDYVKKLKDASKTWSTKIATQVKNSKIAKSISSTAESAKDVGKNIGKGISSTKAGAKAAKITGDVGAAVVKAGKVVGPALGPAGDIVGGAMAISSSAEGGGSDGQKAYKITGDVVGMGLNIVAGLATGPLAIVLVVFQVCGAILDAAWDPFKNYFNSDLETMRLGIIDSLKVAYREVDMNYPIETKPDILQNLNDPVSQDYKDFQNYMKKYMDDRGFISSEDVLAEEEMVLALKSIRRQRKLYKTNENGELEMMDPDMAAVALFDSATNNDLIMMALAAKYAQHKKRQGKPESDLSDTTNYLVVASVISIVFLIFFFSSIFIASI
jgi:hypothetical protein